MHGDIMKKVIKVKYRNIFKYEDHQEVIKFDEKGYLEEIYLANQIRTII